MEPIYTLPPFEAEISAVPLSETADWSLDFLGIPDLWAKTRGAVNGKPIVVCVLDTGCDANHQDLQGGAIIDSADFTKSMWGPADRNGHGTWCASMIGARAGNDIGVRGVAPECQILVAKVLGDSGAGSDASIFAGLDWAYRKGAQFFSLSLGGPAMSERLHSLFREVTQEKGRFVFCAAGNDGGSVNFPARWDESIAVGACDKNGDLVKFSSRGSELDIIAPGVDMLAAAPGNRYATMSGTSMATPVACSVGVLAYAKHQQDGGNTDLTNQAEMLDHLRRTAVKKGQWGLLNPKQLFAEHKPLPPVPSPAPIPPPSTSPVTGFLNVTAVFDGRMFSGPVPEVKAK